jgi:uncharacterized protein with PIN domain
MKEDAKKTNCLQFIIKQKPYKAICAQCLDIIDGDSAEEVAEKLEKEGWVIFNGSLYCYRCYYWD